MKRIHLLLLAFCLDICVACINLPEQTLTSLHSIMDQSSGWVPLCPFKITGSEGCNTVEPYRLRADHQFLQLVCVNNPGESHGCKIDCAGTHFEVGSGKMMLLRGFQLSGATKGSVKVRQNALYVSQYNRYIHNTNSEALSDADWSGAAIQSDPWSRLQLQFDDYWNNSARLNGGALSIEASSASIAGCSFVENSAVGGGGIYVKGGSPQRAFVVQSTFASNTAEKGGASITLENSSTFFSSQNNDGCDNIDPDECNGAIVMLGVNKSCKPFSSVCTSPTAFPTAGE